MTDLKYPGLRLLVGGAPLDREFFSKDFDMQLQQVLIYGEKNNLDLNLDKKQINAVRAAHASGDMRQVFKLTYWPIYDELRQSGIIPEAAGFWEM